MEGFVEFLKGIDHPEHRERMETILSWVKEKFPQLEPAIKWNQPMFTDHGTFIIGFSVAKKHIAVAPELVVMDKFSEEITKAGYEQTKGMFRIPMNQPVNYELLDRIITFNITDKAGCTTFWR